MVTSGCLALEQAQHVLWQGVGLGQHGRAGLLQNLGAGQVGGLGGAVGIHDAAARGFGAFVGG